MDSSIKVVEPEGTCRHTFGLFPSFGRQRIRNPVPLTYLGLKIEIQGFRILLLLIHEPVGVRDLRLRTKNGCYIF